MRHPASRLAPFLVVPLLAGCGAVAPAKPDAVPRVVVHDNRVPAGTLRDGVLTLALEVRPGRWHPEADDGPGEEVLAFAEEGRAPSIPGPLVRVPVGTRVVVRVRNTRPDSAITVRGLRAGDASASDSFVVAPNAVRETRFVANAPGSYFYWASTRGSALEARVARESQLHGAIVVDSAGAPRTPSDRVFVLGTWNEPPDSSGPKPWVPRDMMVINGRSWPHTERFAFTVGDTVRWRWLNPTPDGHPMHLHGFYFTVASRGGWAADTVYAPAERRLAVTELMLPGSTMAMEWVPQAAGNWLFHCHFAFHVSHYLSFAKVADLADPGAPDAVSHHANAMRGLVLGLTVRPRDGSRDAAPDTVRHPPRRLRIVAREAPARYGAAAGYAYVLDDRATLPTAPTVPTLSDPLVLRRGEPVRITVVNALRAPTAVHWHGIELQDSYADGGPGWSGAAPRLAPAIAPRDSFVAAFTPTRSGTFIYHAHSHEGHQIASGLYGALLVLDADVPHDTTTDRTFVIGGSGADLSKGRVNGALQPPPVPLVAGTTYRFRVVQINPDWRVRVSVESPGGTLPWRAIAKDGADLPPAQARVVLVPLEMGAGETADFAFTPDAPGLAHLVVAAREGWTVRVPLPVRAAPARHGGARVAARY
ncbi:MAG: multicopper oxidase domain-containing protein [Gemmatirosa sp.]